MRIHEVSNDIFVHMKWANCDLFIITYIVGDVTRTTRKYTKILQAEKMLMMRTISIEDRKSYHEGRQSQK